MEFHLKIPISHDACLVLRTRKYNLQGVSQFQKKKVLEARPGRNEGTIRAYVEGREGKVVLYAKNGAGKALAAAVGGTVEAKYRRLDKGLFAVQVRPVV